MSHASICSPLDRSRSNNRLRLTPDTGAAELEYAVEVFNAIVKSAVTLRNSQSRIRNRVVPRINHLPPELLSTVWKQTLPRTMDYYGSLNTIRLTCSYWADIVRNDPSFWTVVQCSDPLDLVRISLERSRNLPLQLYFPCLDVPISAEERGEEGSDYVRESHESHYDFMHILQPHIQLRGVSQLRFKAYEGDWGSLSKLITAPAPVLSVLTIGYKRQGSYMNNRPWTDLGELDLCGGVAPSLQVIDLTLCDLPTKYPPLPSLVSCTISHSKVSRNDIILLITVSPVLEELSISHCTALNVDASPPLAARIRTLIRYLRMDDNTVNRRVNDRAIALVSALEYLEAPNLDWFKIRLDESESEFQLSRISPWISNFSRAHPNKLETLALWRGEDSFDESSLITMELVPDFKIAIFHTSQSAESLESVMAGFVEAIHPSAHPSITILNLHLAYPLSIDILPLLASKLPSVTEVFMDHDAPQSWSFLGQRSDGGE